VRTFSRTSSLWTSRRTRSWTRDLEPRAVGPTTDNVTQPAVWTWGPTPRKYRSVLSSHLFRCVVHFCTCAPELYVAVAWTGLVDEKIIIKTYSTQQLFPSFPSQGPKCKTTRPCRVGPGSSVAGSPPTQPAHQPQLPAVAWRPATQHFCLPPPAPASSTCTLLPKQHEE
jgi:hypothetical protein